MLGFIFIIMAHKNGMICKDCFLFGFNYQGENL